MDTEPAAGPALDGNRLLRDRPHARDAATGHGAAQQQRPREPARLQPARPAARTHQSDDRGDGYRDHTTAGGDRSRDRAARAPALQPGGDGYGDRHPRRQRHLRQHGEAALPTPARQGHRLPDGCLGAADRRRPRRDGAWSRRRAHGERRGPVSTLRRAGRDRRRARGGAASHRLRDHAALPDPAQRRERARLQPRADRPEPSGERRREPALRDQRDVHPASAHPGRLQRQRRHLVGGADRLAGHPRRRAGAPGRRRRELLRGQRVHRQRARHARLARHGRAGRVGRGPRRPLQARAQHHGGLRRGRRLPGAAAGRVLRDQPESGASAPRLRLPRAGPGGTRSAAPAPPRGAQDPARQPVAGRQRLPGRRQPRLRRRSGRSRQRAGHR